MATKNTSKPSNHKPAASKPAQKKPVQDSADEDLDGPISREVFDRLPPAKRVMVRVRNTVERFEKRLGQIKNWPGAEAAAARDNLAAGLAAFKTAMDALASLPDDYRPSLRGSAKVEIEAGTLVRLTDARKAEYDGVVEPDCMSGIKVLEVRGNKVVTIMRDGTKAMFPRGHVTVDTSTPPTAAQA